MNRVMIGPEPFALFPRRDKVTCIYVAPNAEIVREHARQGGFPANRVEEIEAIIDPDDG